MPKALDLTDKKFGYLTAIKKAPSRSRKTYWLCRCECGIEKEIQTSHLTNGAITSCGCKKTETAMSHEINKICAICGKEFISQSHKRIYCFDCSPDQSLSSSEYQKAKKRAIKHHLVEYKGGKCERCGYNKCEGALHFHHLNPNEKAFTLSNINISKTVDMNKLLKEADKCILLCANCHAEEHYT